MAEIGLTDQGFVPQTLEEIRDEIETEVREEFGRSLPLGDKTVFGFLIGICAERFAVHWETDEAIYSQMDADAAVKAALTALCKLTGTFKKPASSSTVTEILCGDDATVVATGFTIATASTGKRFATVEDVVLVALDAWTATTAYAVDDRVTNNDLCYVCVTSGVSAGAGGPVGTDPTVDELDGTVEWRYIGEGDAAIDVVAAAVDVGPTVAVAFDLTEIETPVGGVNTAINRRDASLGTLQDTDEQLRLAREADLAAPGTGTEPAMASALRQLDDVVSVTVFFNGTDRTDDDGVPAHRFEAMVQGGDDQDIIDTIWANAPLGVLSHGQESGTAVDSSGRLQPVKFTRPEEIDIHVAIEVIVDPLEFPADGVAQIREAIATSGNEGAAGLDAVASRVASWAWITGVLDVTEVLIGTVDPPTLSVTVPISLRQRAVFDTSNIDVTTSNGTP